MEGRANMTDAYDFSEFTSPLPHPGDILREDFMAPLRLTPGALARAMGLRDRTRIERVSRGAQPVTADTALRLGLVFNTSAQFWINLQSAHDLSVAAIEGREDLAKVGPLSGLEFERP
jgi:addiction module HigA family antidote